MKGVLNRSIDLANPCCTPPQKQKFPFARATKGVVMLNNIYDALRSSIPMPDAARFYGLEINRAGFAACPFHPDNTPSLKIYETLKKLAERMRQLTVAKSATKRKAI